MSPGNNRDPKTNPKAGDVLSSPMLLVTVLRAGEHRMEISISCVILGLSIWNHYITPAMFREWADFAEVIKLGPDI